MEVYKVLTSLDRYGFFNRRLRDLWTEKAPIIEPNLVRRRLMPQYSFNFQNFNFPVKYAHNSLEEITSFMCNEVRNLSFSDLEDLASEFMGSSLITNPWDYMDTEGLDKKLVAKCQIEFFESYQDLTARLYHYLNSREKLKQINEGASKWEYSNLIEATLGSMQYAIMKIKDLKDGRF